MQLRHLQRTWDEYGTKDPLWAIATRPEKKGGKWDVNEFFETGRNEIQIAMKWVESISPSLKRRKALDFGCGAGRLTQALADYFDEVAGVDIAPSMIDLANGYNRHGDKCRYYLNAAEHLRLFADNTFDFIYSSYVLQHISPQYAKGYIKEFLRVLAPEGLLVFQLLGGPTSLFRKVVFALISDRMVQHLRKLRYGTFRPIEVHGIKREEVVKFLAENGAEILDVRDQTSPGKTWQSLRYSVTKSRE
ncbi:MAG: methyltransferase domain-containing protein [Acidobacteriia bacterium]|nr:methyltransferase domain-containing protein [Terriglobia bacterium]